MGWCEDRKESVAASKVLSVRLHPLRLSSSGAREENENSTSFAGKAEETLNRTGWRAKREGSVKTQSQRMRKSQTQKMGTRNQDSTKASA